MVHPLPRYEEGDVVSLALNPPSPFGGLCQVLLQISALSLQESVRLASCDSEFCTVPVSLASDVLLSVVSILIRLLYRMAARKI